MGRIQTVPSLAGDCADVDLSSDGKSLSESHWITRGTVQGDLAGAGIQPREGDNPKKRSDCRVKVTHLG